jgi:hypothetical protein
MSRSLVSGVAVLLCAALFTAAAVGSSDSAVSPSGAFAVSVSYPDMIATGTTATASESLTNNSASSKTFTVTNALVTPTGKTLTQTQVVTVAAGAMFTQKISRKVNASDVGSYTLTFTASDGSESASATARYTVVRR